jgi:hypothetical protein
MRQYGEIDRYTRGDQSYNSHNRGRGHYRRSRGPYRGYRGAWQAVRPEYRGPSSTTSRNPQDQNQPYHINPLPNTRNCQCQCTCSNHDQNHHCVGCCCRELEEERRKSEDKKVVEKGKKSQPASKVEIPKAKASGSQDNKKKSKKAKRTITRPQLTIVGHSFIGHLASLVAWESKDKKMSWEEVMGVGDDNLDLLILGEPGANRFKFGVLNHYVQSNEATWAIVEMGSNDLCDGEDPIYLANDLIVNVSEMIEATPNLQKVIICMVIPRTKMDPDFDAWDVKDYELRQVEFNLQLEERVKDHPKMELWIHRKLMRPKEEWMDKKGVHPVGKGLAIYQESMKQAIQRVLNHIPQQTP